MNPFITGSEMNDAMKPEPQQPGQQSENPGDDRQRRGQRHVQGRVAAGERRDAGRGQRGGRGHRADHEVPGATGRRVQHQRRDRRVQADHRRDAGNASRTPALPAPAPPRPSARQPHPRGSRPGGSPAGMRTPATAWPVTRFWVSSCRILGLPRGGRVMRVVDLDLREVVAWVEACRRCWTSATRTAGSFAVVIGVAAPRPHSGWARRESRRVRFAAGPGVTGQTGHGFGPGLNKGRGPR